MNPLAFPFRCLWEFDGEIEGVISNCLGSKWRRGSFTKTHNLGNKHDKRLTSRKITRMKLICHLSWKDKEHFRYAWGLSARFKSNLNFVFYKSKRSKTIITGNHVLFNRSPEEACNSMMLTSLNNCIKFLTAFCTHMHTHTQTWQKLSGEFCFGSFSLLELDFHDHEPVPNLWFFCLKNHTHKRLDLVFLF